MSKTRETQRRDRLIRQMQALSRAKVNDAVKLAYLSGEELDLIDKLDLTALTEFKRTGNGAVEVKFADRFRAMEKLMALTERDGGDRAEALLRAMSGDDGEDG